MNPIDHYNLQAIWIKYCFLSFVYKIYDWKESIPLKINIIFQQKSVIGKDINTPFLSKTKWECKVKIKDENTKKITG